MLYKRCALNFKTRHFEENLQNWLFSNHCRCRIVPCISMKPCTFVKGSFLVTTNKSTIICFNIFGDCVIQNLKSIKTQKNGIVPMSRQENLADLFLIFLAKLERRLKAFYSYSFIKRSRIEALRHFSANFIKRLP